MHSHPSTSSRIESILPRAGTVVLTGYGLKVAVEHGRLALADGLGGHRRAARFSRATCGIKRLVILGHSGTVTLEALRWLHGIKASVTQVDADGRLILAAGPPNESSSLLRRAQVHAREDDRGPQIVRRLLGEKITGQASVMAEIGDLGGAKRLTQLAQKLADAPNFEAMAFLESQAARAYWGAWASVPVAFARQDRAKVPEHWRSFGTRISPLSGATRNASNPPNAMLNYLYAMLEAETRIALLAVGLDPTLGFLHTDQPNRDSLACDVMEAVRPQVDRWLLEYLRRTSFSRADFFERRDGLVRVSSLITSPLAETGPVWAKAVAPYAEWVATQLPKGAIVRTAQRNKVPPLPTPLTQGNRSRGRDAHRRQASPVPRKTFGQIAFCPECGKPASDPRDKYCSTSCYEASRDAEHLPAMHRAAASSLAKMRDRGEDPAHGGAAARKRAATKAQHAHARKEWAELGLDEAAERARFVEMVLPVLTGVSVARIASATGLSLRYASQVKKGLRVPHPVHFPRLEGLLPPK